MTDMLPTGSVIGILGGGQLGRMLAVAASRLGFQTHIFDPAANGPASHVSHFQTQAAFDDETALRNFARSVAVVTFEFENIPTAALDIVESLAPIRPGRQALAVSQDRLDEKKFLQGLGLKTAPFADVTSLEDMGKALDQVGAPSILKTRRFGYDGKGQVRLKAKDQSAFVELKEQACVLEGFVDFEREISVIAARGISGEVACFDPGENVHKDGILRTTTVPAQINSNQRTDAVILAGQILNALDYVGVLGVELFVSGPDLIVNEIAPRVHNSGHWTQNGCDICQFEQHIRAICGWPLGNGARHSDVRMENLIGNDMARVPQLANDGAAIHLYGKAEIKPGRKMGHVNIRL